MKKNFAGIVAFLIIGSLHSQELISLEYLSSITKSEVTQISGIPSDNDVDYYKVRYTSTAINGSTDTLSGLAAIPVSDGVLHPLLIYSHGTVSSREAVPSRLSFESIITAIYASQGYFTIAPDLLGLGDSKGVHPYLHADSEATASYDMIKAIKENVEENDFRINDQIFNIGYSQGGHTAMALHRYIETESTDGYVVTASAPSSGPYFLSKEMVDFTIGENEYFYPGYLVAILRSYEEVYGNILGEEGLTSVVKPEYAELMEMFVREEIDLVDLTELLVERLIQNHGGAFNKFIFKDDVLNAVLTDPDHPLNVAQRDNDVYDWTPMAPTRLYYCKGDDQVVYTNSIAAETKMNENGAPDVDAQNIGDNFDHGSCIPGVLTLALFFFDSYKEFASGVENEVLVASRLYPNPSNNFIILEEENINSGMITISDLAGRVLVKQQYVTGQLLDTSHLIAGNYILQWNNGVKIESHMMMVVD